MSSPRQHWRDCDIETNIDTFKLIYSPDAVNSIQVHFQVHNYLVKQFFAQRLCCLFSFLTSTVTPYLYLQGKGGVFSITLMFYIILYFLQK